MRITKSQKKHWKIGRQSIPTV